AWLDALAPEARARELLLAFAAKEATFKALDPWLGRYIAFREVEIARGTDATLRATFTPRSGERPFSLEPAEERVEGFLVVAARRPTTPPRRAGAPRARAGRPTAARASRAELARAGPVASRRGSTPASWACGVSATPSTRARSRISSACRGSRRASPTRSRRR